MLLHQRFVPGLAINSYIVGDEKSGEAAVIDPTRDVDGYIAYARDNGLHIRHILETHVHADHVTGSSRLRDRLGAQTVVSARAGADCANIHADDGDQIEFGRAVRRQSATSGSSTRL